MKQTLKSTSVNTAMGTGQATKPVKRVSKVEQAFRAAQAALDTAGVAVHQASPEKLAAAKVLLEKAQRLFDVAFNAHEKGKSSSR